MKIKEKITKKLQINEDKEIIDVKVYNQQSFFKKEYTNIAKGLAILVMLFHHLGLNPELNLFGDSILFTNIATQCKVCVSIFLILSGYGINASFNMKKINGFKENIMFTLKHLKKLMLNYWTIFIIFVGFGVITGTRGLEIYGQNILKNFFIDFMGMADFFSTPTYNATWWFMSLIIILYAIFPVLKFLLKHFPIALGILVVALREFQIIEFYPFLNEYLIVFCMGMIFSEFGLFDKIRKLNKSKIDEIVLSTIFLCFGIFARYKLGGIFDIVAAFSIIFISNNILVHIKGINIILELLGKHSSNMFMLHTFIYKYFFMDLIVKFKHWVLMYLALVLISLSISIIIELSKKYIKILYNKCKNKIKALYEA